MIELPTASIAGDYLHIYRFDPALDLGYREELTLEGQVKRGEAPPAVVTAHQAAYAERRHRYEVALETGDLAELPLKPELTPTKFTLRHPTGEAEAHLFDLLRVRKADDHFVSLARSFVAVCLIGADCWPKLDRRPDDRFGFPRLTDDCLARIALVDDWGLMADLGQRAIDELGLKKKRSPGSSSSPGSSTSAER